MVSGSEIHASGSDREETVQRLGGSDREATRSREAATLKDKKAIIAKLQRQHREKGSTPSPGQSPGQSPGVSKRSVSSLKGSVAPGLSKNWERAASGFNLKCKEPNYGSVLSLASTQEGERRS